MNPKLDLEQATCNEQKISEETYDLVNICEDKVTDNKVVSSRSQFLKMFYSFGSLSLA